LLVEDEALVADYVADVIEDAGHQVIGFAATGQKAVELLERDSIDVAILDIPLKGSMTGTAQLVQSVTGRRGMLAEHGASMVGDLVGTRDVSGYQALVRETDQGDPQVLPVLGPDHGFDNLEGGSAAEALDDFQGNPMPVTEL
jgi:DNA-binding NarL/FixJ family response regulator